MLVSSVSGGCGCCSCCGCCVVGCTHWSPFMVWPPAPAGRSFNHRHRRLTCGGAWWGPHGCLTLQRLGHTPQKHQALAVSGLLLVLVLWLLLWFVLLFLFLVVVAVVVVVGVVVVALACLCPMPGPHGYVNCSASGIYTKHR